MDDNTAFLVSSVATDRLDPAIYGASLPVPAPLVSSKTVPWPARSHVVSASTLDQSFRQSTARENKTSY